MATVRRLDGDRAAAVRRYSDGESVRSIAASLGHYRRWVYKWLARALEGDPTWATDASRRPHSSPHTYPAETVAAVRLARFELYNAGLLCGAQNVRWRLEDLGVTPLPSVRTIDRILVREGLTHRRTGRYAAKGIPDPALPAVRPNQVHQTGLRRPVLPPGAGPVLEPQRRRRGHRPLRPGAREVPGRPGDCGCPVDGLARLGLPEAVQADNEWVFYGSPAHPRGMGLLIRLCLPLGIEPRFIPVKEPWRNGVVERFNGHYESKFLAWVDIPDFAELRPASPAFEARHNSRYRYARLHGQTPLAALQAQGAALRFPPEERAPILPLPKPETGRYHLVRFIRSDQRLHVFGERFPMPPEAEYAYVVATVDVARERLTAQLGADVIAVLPYHLR